MAAVTANSGRRSSAEQEHDYFVRALSHDMSANFMLLEHSFAGLREALGDVARPKLDQAVAHVEACLRESKRFLGDLVDFARTGRVDMEPTRVELAAVVEEVLFEQRDLLVRRSVEVAVERPLPAVWCNRHRLKQVVTNLVRNALKHGCDPQTPQMRISAVDDGSDTATPATTGLVSFRLHDNGPGIAPESHEEAFLPGRRLPEGSDDGSGMGLAIVRKIVEHYGGSVGIDPAPQAGTAIVVSLPRPTQEPCAVRPHKGMAPDSEITGHALGGEDPRHRHRLHPHRAFGGRAAQRGSG